MQTLKLRFSSWLLMSPDASDLAKLIDMDWPSFCALHRNVTCMSSLDRAKVAWIALPCTTALPCAALQLQAVHSSHDAEHTHAATVAQPDPNAAYWKASVGCAVGLVRTYTFTCCLLAMAA